MAAPNASTARGTAGVVAILRGTGFAPPFRRRRIT
jgi:hypothetical protein